MFVILSSGGNVKISAILLCLVFVLIVGASCGEKTTSIHENSAADNSVGPPVTRSEVILTADRYARLHWTMSPIGRTGVSCGGNFISDYMPGDRIGMGYKWGGWTGIDEFLQKIDEGYGTGTGGGADTYDDYSIDCVVGVSCTGLVSRAWHLDEKYTLCYADPDIPRKLCEISRVIDGVDFGTREVDALKKGDAFINEYHTILFVYATRDGCAMVMDSSIPGVRFRKLAWGSLAYDGYQAIRYVNITESDSPPGTTTDPIIIQSDAFPFVHEGNTRDVVSMEFSRYSNAIALSQVGPEVVYKLELKTAGTVTMTIVDLKHEGIDNNIHLLGSLAKDETANMATDCLERADIAITRSLDAGDYFIVVDSAYDLPGEYTLSVYFE
jgi:hypothetical protein